MRSAIYVTLGLAGASTGCRQLLGIDEPSTFSDAGPDVATGDDAMPDSPPDTPPNTVTLTFRQGENGYAGTVDTYLDGGTPNQGKSDNNEVRWSADQDRFGLLRFDAIFGASATTIPADAEIVSATLTLFVSKDCGAAGSIALAATPWAETVTFNTFGPAPGVDASDVGDAAGSAPFLNGQASIDVTSSVDKWAGGENLGWIITGVVGAGECAARSREDGILANRPSLTVTFR